MTDKNSVDVLIVTCNPSEQRAVLQALSPGKTPPIVSVAGAAHAYDHGTVGLNRVLHLHTRQGEDSAVSVAQAIGAWHPGAVVAVGICWGAHSEERQQKLSKRQQIGDVLIADKIKAMGARRLEDGKIEYPGPLVNSTRRLAESLMLVLPFWEEASGKGHDMGLMLSSPTLYNDDDACKAVLAAFPNALGGEMEAQGIERWALELKTDWIMFKGICDWGANKDNPYKQAHQEMAAARAASLLKMWLDMGDLRLGDREAEPSHRSGPDTGGNLIIKGDVATAINAPRSTFHFIR